MSFREQTNQDKADWERPLMYAALLWIGLALAVYLGLQLAYSLGWVEGPPLPHQCEIWQATDPSLDLEKCYAAFETEP